MRQSSIIIHKGGKETKYEIYVEDYVISFLKGETDSLGLSEFYFYGYKEKSGRKYIIYGAGREKNLSVFKKYNLLEEIGCRLTQAGPVFLVREAEGAYEVKGYDVFYQENGEMQSYLIEGKDDHDGVCMEDGLKKENAGVRAGGRSSGRENAGIRGGGRSDGRENAGIRGGGRRGGRENAGIRTGGRSSGRENAGIRTGGRSSGRENAGVRTGVRDSGVESAAGSQRPFGTSGPMTRQTVRNMESGTAPHSAISMQLGVILILLVAIVINSTNSYDKMRQLNQSAAEVFFAMENQEAEQKPDAAGGKDEVVVRRDMPPEDERQEELLLEQGQSDAGQEEILRLVTLENEEEADGQESVEGQDGQDGAGEEDPSQSQSDTDKNSDGENNENIEGTDRSDKAEKDGAEEADKSDKTEKDGTEEADKSDKAEGDGTEGADKSDKAEEDGGEVEALSRNVARYYKVERGDTLYMISQKVYGDTAHVKKICELNQITDPDNIRYGQKIILP